MPPVRRRAKSVVMVDPEDIMRLDIGLPPRFAVADGAAWHRVWAKRWPAEGAALMDSLPRWPFAWAIATFGDPRRRRASTRPVDETEETTE